MKQRGWEELEAYYGQDSISASSSSSSSSAQTHPEGRFSLSFAVCPKEPGEQFGIFENGILESSPSPPFLSLLPFKVPFWLLLDDGECVVKGTLFGGLLEDRGASKRSWKVAAATYGLIVPRDHRWYVRLQVCLLLWFLFIESFFLLPSNDVLRSVCVCVFVCGHICGRTLSLAVPIRSTLHSSFVFHLSWSCSHVEFNGEFSGRSQILNITDNFCTFYEFQGYPITHRLYIGILHFGSGPVASFRPGDWVPTLAGTDDSGGVASAVRSLLLCFIIT